MIKPVKFKFVLLDMGGAMLTARAMRVRHENKSLQNRQTGIPYVTSRQKCHDSKYMLSSNLSLELNSENERENKSATQV